MLRLTPSEKFAVKWALAAVNAVLARAEEEGRIGVDEPHPVRANLQDLMASVDSGYISATDLNSIVTGISAACDMAKTLPTVIWNSLKPPELADLQSAKLKLQNYAAQRPQQA